MGFYFIVGVLVVGGVFEEEAWFGGYLSGRRVFSSRSIFSMFRILVSLSEIMDTRMSMMEMSISSSSSIF